MTCSIYKCLVLIQLTYLLTNIIKRKFFCLNKQCHIYEMHNNSKSSMHVFFSIPLISWQFFTPKITTTLNWILSDVLFLAVAWRAPTARSSLAQTTEGGILHPHYTAATLITSCSRDVILHLLVTMTAPLSRARLCFCVMGRWMQHNTVLNKWSFFRRKGQPRNQTTSSVERKEKEAQLDKLRKQVIISPINNFVKLCICYFN